MAARHSSMVYGSATDSRANRCAGSKAHVIGMLSRYPTIQVVGGCVAVVKPRQSDGGSGKRAERLPWRDTLRRSGIVHVSPQAPQRTYTTLRPSDSVFAATALHFGQ